MLISILSILLVFIIAICIDRKCGHESWYGVIAFSVAIGMVVAIVAHIATWPLSIEHRYIRTEREIVATKADSRIEGDIRGGFFFVRTRIDEKDYYIVLTKACDIYRQARVPVENTVIVETVDAPRVVRNIHYADTKWSNLIRFHEAMQYVDEKDTIYVPIGTVSDGMNFDVF